MMSESSEPHAPEGAPRAPLEVFQKGSQEGLNHSTFARLDALVNWERRSRRVAARFSLEPMRDLLARLGSPQHSVDPACRVVHVAGSKGKGSVAALVARAAGAAGLRVGRYGSPHVESIEERVEIDGQNIETGLLARALENVMDAREAALAAKTPAADATWFDVMTAAALVLFRDAALDLWVLECGLGGRLDSTNAVDAGVAVITSIELEHTEVLGSTRAAIALEKAGILKPAQAGRAALLVCGVPRQSSDGEPDEAWKAIEQRAHQLGATCAQVPGVETEAQWELLSIEERNQRLARVVLAELGVRGLRAQTGEPLGPEHLTEQACRAARLPGRLERGFWELPLPATGALEAGEQPRRVTCVLDGAHTPASVRSALGSLEADGTLIGRPTVVLALANDKDLRGILKTLERRADQLVCTSVGSELFRSPEQIAAVAVELGWVVSTAPSPRAALEQAVELTHAGGWILALGSLYLAGHIRPLLTTSPQ